MNCITGNKIVTETMGGVGLLPLFFIALSRWLLDMIFNNRLLLNLNQAVSFYQVFFHLKTLNYEQAHLKFYFV